MTDAVIVAAGIGSRLGWAHHPALANNHPPASKAIPPPKGSIPIGHTTIIERSISLLRKAGIGTIYIGIGHNHQFYQQLERKYDAVRCVLSKDYASTNSMHTLYQFRDMLAQDFLLLESDILYEYQALESLLGTNSPTILVSDATHSQDEVFIQHDPQMRLQKLSKNPHLLDTIDAELVGISLLNQACFAAMCQYYQSEGNAQMHYEEALVAVAQSLPIYVYKPSAITWCEIDTKEHLERARHTIWPRIILQELESNTFERNVLLNPGPATTSRSVKLAQIVPDICPREHEFGVLMQQVVEGLTGIVAPLKDFTSVLFGSSGTGAVEAVISSVIPADGNVLIINNGAYGKRMAEIATAYGITHQVYASSPLEPLDIGHIEDTIAQGTFSHIAVVHHETTTGLRNPIADIGALAQRYSISCIVDAMSSYAALPIDMASDGIDFLCASSNKNLQAMAGVAFVVCNIKALQRTATIAPRNHYFHLYAQHAHFTQSGQTRFTPPVQTLYALHQALQETYFEGVEQRYARYCRMWEKLIAGLNRLGFSYLVPRDHHAKIITCVKLPHHIDFNHLHQYCYQRHFTIYPGKISDYNCFRLANIGDITEQDIDAFLVLLQQYLDQIAK